jgi:hypothetical protein
VYGCSLGPNRNQAPRRATSPTTPRTTASPMPALSIPKYGPSVLVRLVGKVIDVDEVEVWNLRVIVVPAGLGNIYPLTCTAQAVYGDRKAELVVVYGA